MVMSEIKEPEVIVDGGKEYLKVPVKPGDGPCSGCIFNIMEKVQDCFAAPWCGPRFIFISVKEVQE